MMDRRAFLEAAAAFSALAATPLAAQAALRAQDPYASLGTPKAAAGTASTTTLVRIVHRGDLVQSVELARHLASSLRSLGIATSTIAGDAEALGRFAGIDAIVNEARDARIVGLLDEAGAVLFQQIAAMHGRACAVEARHRFDDGLVRHCMRALDDPAARSWSEPVDGWAERMGERHAQWLAGLRSHAIDAASATTSGPAHAAGIVSFVITL